MSGDVVVGGLVGRLSVSGERTVFVLPSGAERPGTVVDGEFVEDDGEPSPIRALVDPPMAQRVLETLSQRPDPRAALPEITLPDGTPTHLRWPRMVAALSARAPMTNALDAVNALAHRLEERNAPLLSALAQVRLSLLAEVACVLSLSTIDVHFRTLRRARAEPPRTFRDHTYVGAFDTRGKLVVSDFCYLGSPKSSKVRSELRGRRGRYHAWVQWQNPRAVHGRSLLLLHESALDRFGTATDVVAYVGNDAGMIGVFDAEVTSDGPFTAWLSSQAEGGAPIEGITEARGVLVSTEGDGGWTVRGLLDGDEFVVLKVALAYDANGRDEPALLPHTESAEIKRYSPKVTFGVGDALEHPKFGQGRVLRATKENVTVAFADDERVLVHGR
jgi:hypothetical protein